MTENPWLEAARHRGMPAAPRADDGTPATAEHDANAGKANIEPGNGSERTVPAPPVTGAAVPQASVAPPVPGEGLPLRMVRPTSVLWLVGAHGGAGETTLAGLDPRWAEGNRSWPTPVELDDNCPCLLVARTHASGLRSAQTALRQWASGALGASTPLLGLVLVPDAPGRLPKPLRELAAHVGGGAPRVWNLSWVDAWRTGEQLTPAQLPKSINRFVAEASSLAAGHH